MIVSGYATAENEARAKAAGVSAVLHKPLSPQMIENSARDALLEKETVATPAAIDRVPAEASAASVERMPEGASDWGREAAWTARGAAHGTRLRGGAALRRAGGAVRLPLWYGGIARRG